MRNQRTTWLRRHRWGVLVFCIVMGMACYLAAQALLTDPADLWIDGVQFEHETGELDYALSLQDTLFRGKGLSCALISMTAAAKDARMGLPETHHPGGLQRSAAAESLPLTALQPPDEV